MIKTGDEKNSGTDANVWVQVYGDKGDTGHVQLKKSGMMENLFERGQTDYFTLEAGDVGKVCFEDIMFDFVLGVFWRITVKPIGRKIRIPGIANSVQKGKEIKNLKKKNSPEALDGFLVALEIRSQLFSPLPIRLENQQL